MELNFVSLKEEVKRKPSKPLIHSCNSLIHIHLTKHLSHLHPLGQLGINVPLYPTPRARNSVCPPCSELILLVPPASTHKNMH